MIENKIQIIAIGIIFSQFFLFFCLTKYGIVRKYLSYSDSVAIATVFIVLGSPIFLLGLLLLTVKLFFALLLLLIFNLTLIIFLLKSGVIPRFSKDRYFYIYTPFAILIGWHLYINLYKPEISFDGMLYHGPILGNIISTGSIWSWDVVNQYQFYSDLSIISAVPISKIFSSVMLDDAIQVPYLFLILVMIYAWIIKFNHVKLLSFSAALIIVSAPVIWVQPRIMYVDLAYAAALVSAGFLLTSFNSKSNYIYTAQVLSIGSVIGTKPAGLLIGGVLLLFLVVKSVMEKNFYGFFKLTSLVGISLGSAGFYIRNFIEFNNPMFPVAANFFGISFPGLVDLSIFTKQTSLGGGVVDFQRINGFLQNIVSGASVGIQKLDYDPRLGGFSFTTWAIVGLLLISLYVRLFNKKKMKMSKFFVISLLILIILMLQPSTQDSRYVIAPFVFLFIATFSLIPPLKYRVQWLLALLLIIFGLGNIYWTEKNIFIGYTSIAPFVPSQNSREEILKFRFSNSAFDWLPKDRCTNLAIEINGGVSQSGMIENSPQNVFGYGYYGDDLCNNIYTFKSTDLASNKSEMKRVLYSNLLSAEFILIYPESLEKIKASNRFFERDFIKIQEIVGTEMFPQSQIIYQRK